jgi:hypothetical protein
VRVWCAISKRTDCFGPSISFRGGSLKVSPGLSPKERPMDDGAASMSSLELSAELSQRVVDVAHILAAGILRLHARSALAMTLSSEISPDSPPEGLEVPAKTALSVHVG